MDVANPTRREMAAIRKSGYESAAECTKAALQTQGAQCEVVKAVNTLAAYPLLGCYTQNAAAATVVAGDNEQVCLVGGDVDNYEMQHGIQRVTDATTVSQVLAFF